MTSERLTHRTFDPPHAIEVMVFEVRDDALDAWLAADHEFWSVAEAERFPFYVGKETWVRPGEGLHEVTVVITWSDRGAWEAIDRGWVEEQERRFADAVGADAYRVVAEPHLAAQYLKVSEYR